MYAFTWQLARKQSLSEKDSGVGFRVYLMSPAVLYDNSWIRNLFQGCIETNPSKIMWWLELTCCCLLFGRCSLAMMLLSHLRIRQILIFASKVDGGFLNIVKK